MNKFKINNGNVIELENGNKFLYIDDRLYCKDLEIVYGGKLDTNIMAVRCLGTLETKRIIAVYETPYALNHDMIPIWKETDWSKVEKGTPVVCTDTQGAQSLYYFGYKTHDKDGVTEYIVYATQNINNTYSGMFVRSNCMLLEV